MSDPDADIPDQVIRVELKRMVERCRAELLEELNRVAAEVGGSTEGSPQARQQVLEKLQASRDLGSMGYDQMIAFIDRP